MNNEKQITLILVTHLLMCNEILKKDYKEAFPIGRWGTRVYPFSLVPLVTMLQRGNVEKVLVAHGFNRGKNEYKEIKL